MAVPTSTAKLVSQALSGGRSKPGDADVVFHGLSVEGAGQGVCIGDLNNISPRTAKA